MTTFYRVIHRIIAVPVRFLYRVEIRGAENVPQEGALLVCANHTAFSDVLVIAACLNRQVRYMAKAELFRIPVLRKLIAALGAFPVNRGAADMGAIKQSLRVLTEGEVLGVFPQGTRFASQHPSKSKAKSGVGLMVCRTGCTVQPIGISTKAYKLHIFRKTVVTFGKPIPSSEWEILSSTPAEHRRVADGIFAAVCDLVE